MLDFTKSGEILKYRQSLHDLTGYSSFCRTYGFDKCHYLTQALSEKLEANQIILFYLSGSNQIIHSAVLLKGKVVDCYGVSDISDTELYYNSLNYMTGCYQTSGECKHIVINSSEFEPNIYYSSVSEEKSDVRFIADKWFDISGQLKPLISRTTIDKRLA